MEQEGRVRPMSREETAAYQGVTVDESGSAPHTGEGQTPYGNSSGGGGRGSSVRYIRIGGAAPRSSFLTSLLWAAVVGTLLALFIFVALPAIVMVIAGILVLGAIVSLVGRGRIMSWLVRRLYGR
ncbi:peptidase M48 [Selenomonas dianae]|uniref:Peptidase M48 n=1 Tax=Selenomonas dianae TaxID=135079 RepID=A0ABN0SX56_9FIRM|nr:peptidase M48 [Selenomonas dianae]WLD82975.1 peptidase M48 [Selenomonas dianae]